MTSDQYDVLFERLLNRNFKTNFADFCSEKLEKGRDGVITIVEVLFQLPPYYRVVNDAVSILLASMFQRKMEVDDMAFKMLALYDALMCLVIEGHAAARRNKERDKNVLLHYIERRSRDAGLSGLADRIVELHADELEDAARTFNAQSRMPALR